MLIKPLNGRLAGKCDNLNWLYYHASWQRIKAEQSNLHENYALTENNTCTQLTECTCPSPLWYITVNLCLLLRSVHRFQIPASMDRTSYKKIWNIHLKQTSILHYIEKDSNVVPVKTCIIMLFWILNTVIVYIFLTTSSLCCLSGPSDYS